MEDNDFGEVEFVETDADEGFKRRDNELYTNFIKRLVTAQDAAPPGKRVVAKLPVSTGALRSSNVKTGKGRGVNELAEAKLFQKAANDMGHGLNVAYRHQQNGTTILRMSLTKKRTFTDEQTARRIEGQNKRLYRNYTMKIAEMQRVLDADPENEKALVYIAATGPKLAKVEKALGITRKQQPPKDKQPEG